MSIRTKARMVASFAVLGLVAAGGMWLLDTARSNDVPVDLMVAYLPAQRDQDIEIRIRFDGKQRLTDGTRTSPWRETIYVKPGTIVTLVAQQSSGERLACTISTRNGLYGPKLANPAGNCTVIGIA